MPMPQDLPIGDNCIVTLMYTLREGNYEGDILEQVDASWPFVFFFGGERLLPAFEAALEGLLPGARFDFMLKPEDAYGDWDPDAVLMAPIAQVEGVDGLVMPNELAEGDPVIVRNAEGEAYSGVVMEREGQMLRVDTNHFMAGKALHFQGQVLRVRPATVDEIIRRSPIQEDGVRR